MRNCSTKYDINATQKDKLTSNFQHLHNWDSEQCELQDLKHDAVPPLVSCSNSQKAPASKNSQQKQHKTCRDLSTLVLQRDAVPHVCTKCALQLALTRCSSHLPGLLFCFMLPGPDFFM